MVRRFKRMAWMASGLAIAAAVAVTASGSLSVRAQSAPVVPNSGPAPAYALVAPATAGSVPPDPLIAQIVQAPPIWAENFQHAPQLADWARGYSPWPNTIGNRILLGGEREVYLDAPYLDRDLLQWHTGQVTLVAERMTAADRAAIDARMRAEHTGPPQSSALTAADWVSAMLKGSHAFQYGYVEIQAQADLDPSAWPAFWLLPAKWGWPPEIDILEIPGDRTAHQTLHSLPGDPQPHPTVRTPIGPAFHTYGVLWGPDRIRFYVDRHQTADFPTPPDMHQPMYPVLNLAVGGWAKMPGAQTPKQLTMHINYVRWWPLLKNEVSVEGEMPNNGRALSYSDNRLQG